MRYAIFLFVLCSLSAHLVGCAESEIVGHRVDMENQCIHKEREVIEHVQAREPDTVSPAHGCYYRASDDSYWTTNNLIPSSQLSKSSLVESTDCPSTENGYCESSAE